VFQFAVGDYGDTNRAIMTDELMVVMTAAGYNWWPIEGYSCLGSSTGWEL